MKPGLWSWRYFGNNALTRKPCHDSTDIDGNQTHRVVTEDIDDLDADDVAARAFVAVFGADQFDLAVLARAETLPFVLEDIAAGAALLVLLPAEKRWSEGELVT
jgi:hypothetical protein